MKFKNIVFNEMKFLNINTSLKNKYITVNNSKSADLFFFIKINKLDYFIDNYKKENITEECFDLNKKVPKNIRIKDIKKIALKFKKFKDNKNKNYIFEYLLSDKEHYYFFFQNNVLYGFLNYNNEVMFGIKEFHENQSKAIGFLLEDFEVNKPDKGINTEEAVSKIFAIIKDKKMKKFIFSGTVHKVRGKTTDKTGKTSRDRLYFYMLNKYFGKENYTVELKDDEFHVILK